MLEKYEKIGKLYDYYSGLLSEKHKEVLDLYYFQDLSLAEISEILNVTRQGVFDLLKRAENNLEKYEEKLLLIERNSKITFELEAIKKEINDKFVADEIIVRIEKLIDSL
jgi:predicted DNA-binding protein YlxM (UPF0122 family)